jgi:hypothetical protein
MSIPIVATTGDTTTTCPLRAKEPGGDPEGGPQGAVRPDPLDREARSGQAASGVPPTPARPNDGGIDFSSRTVQVAGASSLRRTRQTTRSATGRAGAPARAAVIGTLDCDRELVFSDTKPVAERRAQYGDRDDGWPPSGDSPQRGTTSTATSFASPTCTLMRDL